MRRALLGLLLAVTLAAPVQGAELVCSAAISVKEAVQEVARRFGGTHPGATIRFNFGGSGELQKQIEAGAPVDLFISAGARQLEELERRGLLLPGTRRVFARNALTVIVPGGTRLELGRPADLADPRVGRIVIGNPRTVPAGQYAEQSLRALGLWERLRDRLILAENVRQALEYVARGEVDAGFVYVTDARVGGARVREAFRPPEDTYGPIVYPAAVVAESRHPALARAFLAALVGAEGRAVLARLGYALPPERGHDER
jgi:molybdate transport system substrate-binding protein